MKKLLSVLLVAVMVLGLAGTAFAATTPSTVAGAKFSDIAGNDAEGDITLLAVKGILKGDSGATTVRPDSTISRAEFAAMIVRMLNKDTLAASLAQIKPTTKDEIPAWAWGYVNLATSMGIMKGYPDGSFLPNNNVTFAEALAMLERSIGLDKKAVGAWPTNYLVVAYDADLVDGVDVFADVPATRGDVAIMMVNTMYTPKFVGVNADTGADVTTAAIISGTAVVEGVVTAVTPDTNTIDISGVGSKTLAASVSLAGAANFSELVNVNVKMVLVSSKVVFIEVTDTANVITGTFDSIVHTTATDENTYVKLTNGNKYAVKDLLAGVTGKFNKTAMADYTAVHATLAKNDSVILNLVDGKVVYVEAARVNMKNYTVKAAATTNADKIDYDITFQTAANPGVDTNSFAATNKTPVTIDGVAKTIADLKANDVVYVTTEGAAIAADTNILSIDAFRATVKGDVTAVRVGAVDTVVTLKLADGTSKDYVLSFVTAPAVGNTVEYRLNKAGEARVPVSTSTTANVGYIVDYWTALTTGADKYFVKLDQAGTEKTFELAALGVYTAIDTAGADAFVEFTTAGGKIDAITETRTPTDVTTGKVYAVDAVNGIVVIKDGANYYTFGTDGLSVYQDNGDATFSSIGLAGLAKDDLVKYQAAHYDLLVRQDQ